MARLGAGPDLEWVMSEHFSFPFPLVILGRQKPGKWCAMHVRVAYMILRHQEKMKVLGLGGLGKVGRSQGLSELWVVSFNSTKLIFSCLITCEQFGSTWVLCLVTGMVREDIKRYSRKHLSLLWCQPALGGKLVVKELRVRDDLRITG